MKTFFSTIAALIALALATTCVVAQEAPAAQAVAAAEKGAAQRPQLLDAVFHDSTPKGGDAPSGTWKLSFKRASDKEGKPIWIEKEDLEMALLFIANAHYGDVVVEDPKIDGDEVTVAIKGSELISPPEVGKEKEGVTARFFGRAEIIAAYKVGVPEHLSREDVRPTGRKGTRIAAFEMIAAAGVSLTPRQLDSAKLLVMDPEHNEGLYEVRVESVKGSRSVVVITKWEVAKRK